MSTIAYIVGTGDYAKALAKKFLLSGYKVQCGSRHPDRRNLEAADTALSAVQVVHLQNLVKNADVLFLATHAEHYDCLKPFSKQLAGKVLVDVSNPTELNDDQSNAESLQIMVREAHVVKAFNTISAYSLESQASGESKTVHLCGNHQPAKDLVSDIARNLGFNVLDHGKLTAAKELENMPLYLFKEWQGAFKVTAVMLTFWLVYGMARYLYIKKDPYAPERAPSNITNKAFACTALTLLALCYLPGCLAGFLQIINGTKHKRFPDWLDDWLKMRKQLGNFALFFGILHLVISVALMSPSYFKSWYLKDSVAVESGSTIALTSRMNWIGEIVLVSGVIAIVLMSILGLTSIQAVGDLLNWREWTFVHSYLGYSCLFTAACHVTVIAVPDWLGEPWYKAVQRLTLLSSILPWVAIALKLVLSLPGINGYLWKIRRGWERESVATKKEN